jgi:hypothetical protein
VVARLQSGLQEEGAVVNYHVTAIRILALVVAHRLREAVRVHPQKATEHAPYDVRQQTPKGSNPQVERDPKMMRGNHGTCRFFRRYFFILGERKIKIT